MSLPPARARALLTDQLEKIPAPPVSSEALNAWREKASAAIRVALGPDHVLYPRFEAVKYSPVMIAPGTEAQIDHAYQRSRAGGLNRARSILEAAIYELDVSELAGPEPEADEAASVLGPADRARIEVLISELRRGREPGGELAEVDREDGADIDSGIEVLESAMRSPKPKRSIIQAALGELRGVIRIALGTAGATGLIWSIEQVVHALGG